MFIGHFAVAFGAKKAAPGTSLGTLFAAAQFIDLLWPLLLLLGVEQVQIDPGNTPMTPLDFDHYPFSHSLVAVILWGLLLGSIYFVARRYPKGALVVGIGVISHWVLDALAHRPDLPLAPGSEVFVGLGLWYFPVATVVLELLLLGVALLFYLKATAPRDRIGSFGLWSLVVLLLAIYAINLLGPPPSDVAAIAVAGNLLWLFVLWAYWVDRHRAPAVRRAI